MRCSLFALLLLLLTAPAAWAGGPFYTTLYETYCTGLPGKQRLGCHGYLQYRIQRGKDRQESLNKCDWGCGEVTRNPADTENCRAGCAIANSKDS